MTPSSMNLAKDQPVVENGEVVPGKAMRVNATFDHRFINGFQAGTLSKVLHEVLENPFEHLDPIDSFPEDDGAQGS